LPTEYFREDFKANKIDNLITVTHRNACKEGFGMTSKARTPCLELNIPLDIADAVFLDLPAPWEAIGSAVQALKDNGMLCSFSPCIEQVQVHSSECLSLN
jgi:tRNA (adenine57-N1/adenine58-N1)-methyltransferase